MFQADYHLKELSMGEYEQPVLGMKSGFDISEDQGHTKWRAREWFVVRKAEVCLSTAKVLVPRIKMGVEAREQIVGKRGLEDAVITRADHPMVKYAEAFTHNFDLIAERKSVIFHLRELAKASVLAKFLIDAEMSLDDNWFNLAEKSKTDGRMEIPQLWNERYYSRIHVQDGQTMKTEHMVSASTETHSVYGGVDLGLEKLALPSLPSPLAPPPAVKFLPAGPIGAAPRAAMIPGPRGRGRELPPMPMTLREKGASDTTSMLISQAQGVDLNLDEFDLSQVSKDEGDCSKSLGACLPIGTTFWPSINSSSESEFEEEQKSLFRKIFNVNLSDRRDEGSMFIPPENRFAYVQKLRSLINEEDNVRDQRQEHFFSSKFVVGDAGSWFPPSWTNSHEIKRGRDPQRAAGVIPAGSSLVVRSDHTVEASLFEHVLKTSEPAFERSTEDGVRFRIYRVGSLEVRTIKEHDGKERIGMVFSIRSTQDEQRRVVGAHELIVKVMQYVTYAGDSNRVSHYAVLQTEKGNFVVTEALRNGTVTWEESPKDLQDRNSLAKVIRSAYCRSAKVTIKDMKLFFSEEQKAFADMGRASHSECKHYAQGFYSYASRTSGLYAGWRQRRKDGNWQLTQTEKKEEGWRLCEDGWRLMPPAKKAERTPFFEKVNISEKQQDEEEDEEHQIDMAANEQ
eukprot:gnl/TRDRNA2_/TRDRNA2_163937_c2_seq1.p1 gnl/TRDRNA2_/TRDRNA2_163937_c2~~gnl/TRDRNA2_/TRDRNA2_163937_c2_seq1.p1  ORF type:complete len:784 (+),score=135.55 gnl/TRDRNA2_/TRDRNA2_163937_c2_seq1:314-2353(+)